MAPQPLSTPENKPFSLVLTSVKWSMTQNTCHLQLVGKFKKLKKKWKIRFSLSLLFSCNFYVVASLCLWMETLISDPFPREFLSSSTNQVASLLWKLCRFKNIKPGTLLKRMGKYLSYYQEASTWLLHFSRVPGESVFLPSCPFATVNECCTENLVPNEVRSKTVIDS